MSTQKHQRAPRIEDLARQPEQLTPEQAEAAQGGSILLIKTPLDVYRESHPPPNS